MSLFTRRVLAPLLCLLLFLGLGSVAFADDAADAAPVQVLFLCDDEALLQYLTVRDAAGQICSPDAPGEYTLSPGEYSYIFHDESESYEDMEETFTAESGYTAQFLRLDPDPVVTAEWVSTSWINPIYADVLDVSDLKQPDLDPEAELAELIDYVKAQQSGKRRFFRDVTTPYTDINAAALDLRNQIKEFENTATLRLYVSGQVDASQWNALVLSLFSKAIAHTGVSTEGDYLRYEYGGYNAAGGLTYDSTANRTLCRFTYELKHFTTAAQEAELTPVVSGILSSLALEGKSDYQKILAIYSYLCDHTKYGGSGGVQYTAYGALVNHLAVCQGYSTAFYRLCLEAGVDTRIITSSAMKHAWNIAALGGQYYEMDCTWDTGYAPENYRYLLRGSEYWLKNHRYNGTSVTGDEFNDSAFAAAYPLPAEDLYFRVSFDANGGSGAPEAQSVRPCKSLSLSAYTPTRTGYSFQGWAASRYAESGSKDSYTPTGSVTLYAAWSPNKYTVTFSTNGGSAVAAQTVEYWKSAKKPAAPVKDGFCFAGWYANSTFSKVYDFTAPVTGNTSVYARWIATDLLLPAALTELGEEAFAGCTNFAVVYIPASVTVIADNAFGTASGLTVLGKPGSAAETYAKNHGFVFVAVD